MMKTETRLVELGDAVFEVTFIREPPKMTMLIEQIAGRRRNLTELKRLARTIKSRIGHGSGKITLMRLEESEGE